MSEIRRTVQIDDVRTFRVTLGDITAEDVDAIVNAANSRLAHGGGVAAAIARAAGPALNEESREWVREHGPVPTGEAVVTGAGKLPHEGVIHAVGPREGEGDEEELLASAVANALDRVHDRGWRSVALPAISAGVFAVPYDVCARGYAGGVRRHLEEHPDSGVREVRLTLFQPDEALLDAVDLALDAAFGG